MLSGTCASFTEVACASGATLTPALTSPLTQGNTYYIRIHKNTSGIIALSHTFDICVTDAFQRGSRMNEIFARTVLSPASVLNYPWEVTYGVDGNLWVTEAQGYKMSKIDPNTGVKTTVLDLSAGSTWLPSPLDSLNGQINSSWSPWPQGGFAGMALHPNFLDGTGNTDFVYVAYVHRFLSGTAPSGLFYRNKLVRFTYNSGTGKLEAPVVICDTLPGSKDHNSQRMIIAPVVKGGTNYLFYGEGDMGAGQFENQTRTNKAQNVSSYEGKILRFNLVPDVPAGAAPWIPDDNPYSPTSAVYAVGFRNNQGFAYDTALNILYGSSHGPYSDDEINIIEPHRNYGHPLVIGYAEGNYNGNPVQGSNNSISAGAAWGTLIPAFPAALLLVMKQLM
ncbi:MAG: PQQ-dependent sugar dehydrogenase [Ferruginibacter sp.]